MTVTEEVRDFQFVSNAELTQLKAWLSEQLGKFAAGWWRDTAILKFVDVSEFYTETDLYQEYRIFRNYRCGGEQIVFIGDDSVWRGLFRSLMGGEEIDNPALSKFVLERFCHGFCRLVAGNDIELTEVTAGDHENVVNRYGSGCVSVELDVDGIPISVLLTRGVWKGVVTAEKFQDSAISAVMESLRTSTAMLSAYFQSESIDCGFLVGLREGDFVPLGQDFTGRVSVSCGDVPVAFSGILGRCGNSRAVKVQK